LPTEQRFKKLSDLQKLFLFQSWLDQPTSEEVRYSYLSEMFSKALVTKEDEKNFAKLGYTSDQLSKIKDELAKAGMT